MMRKDDARVKWAKFNLIFEVGGRASVAEKRCLAISCFSRLRLPSESKTRTAKALKSSASSQPERPIEAKDDAVKTKHADVVRHDLDVMNLPPLTA